MIKVTYTLKNLTDAFYNGNGESLPGLLNMSDADKFAKLNKLAFGDMKHNIKMRIGSDQFRDKVELNSMLRNPCKWSFKLEPRKGYKLATFEISN